MFGYAKIQPLFIVGNAVLLVYVERVLTASSSIPEDTPGQNVLQNPGVDRPQPRGSDEAAECAKTKFHGRISTE